jgi:hypothetical protein
MKERGYLQIKCPICGHIYFYRPICTETETKCRQCGSHVDIYCGQDGIEVEESNLSIFNGEGYEDYTAYYAITNKNPR